MNIYFHIAENSGVGMYRMYLPALAIRKNKLANVLINDFTWGESILQCATLGGSCKYEVRGFNSEEMINSLAIHREEKHKKTLTPEEKLRVRTSIFSMRDPTPEKFHAIGNWADIIIFARKDIPNYIATFGGLREYFNIPVVMDTDDNVRAVRPSNPGFRGYHAGSEALIWHAKAVSIADALTVSTDYLKRCHAEENEHIYVLENALEFYKWERAKRIPHKEIRIGALMSASHWESLEVIKDAIDKILARYPNTVFMCTNMFFDRNVGLLTPLAQKYKKRVISIPWINLKEWPEKSVEQSFDIGLAPLCDNLFNRCKSNLRWLEYSASRVASIVSPVEAYKCVKDGETALVAERDEWFDKISYLIKHPAERRRIADNAFKEVKEKYDIFKNAHRWVETYEEIIKRFTKKHGKRRFPKRDILGGKAQGRVNWHYIQERTGSSDIKGISG